MASVKVKFRPSLNDNHEGTIYYQIIHERTVRQLFTEYHIYNSEWDVENSRLIAASDSSRHTSIQTIKERIRWDIERIERIIKGLESKGLPFRSKDIVDIFRKYEKENSVFNLMETMIIKFKCNGKSRTAETYRSTLNSFKSYRENKDLMIEGINSDVIEGYEAYLQNRQVIPNTISFYMRILRAVYNRAVENGLIEQRYPFRHVYTGVDKTIKRALSIEDIRKIKNIDLSYNPTLDYARNIFMMSFYLRGMSLVDMAYLKKNDLKNGSIVYRRRKTGQQLIIKWTEEMDVILKKHRRDTGKYLLPIIPPTNTNERSAYRNAGYKINYNLKKIAEKLDIPIPLTLYVARHSWASVAKAKGIPIRVISEGMGHDSETTTQIYLASLDTSVVDKANSIIINAI